MPPGYNFPRGAEVLAPLAFTPELSSNRSNHAYLTRACRGIPSTLLTMVYANSKERFANISAPSSGFWGQ
jgi:hypothetical protein